MAADSDEEVNLNSTRTLVKKNSSKGALKITDKFGARYVLAFWAFMGFVNVYALRVNLSVALVAMVNTNTSVNVTKSHVCPNGDNTTSKSENGPFNWDSRLQGVILGSFFYGYIFTQIPGGYLAERFGGKIVFGLGVFWTAVLTLFTPLAANHGAGYLIAVRVMEGVGEGVTFPAMHSMWSKWAPPLERSKLVSFTYAGAQLGTVFGMPLSGVLAKYGFAGGWPSVFYVFGMCGCAWFVVWMLVVSDTPESHPRITDVEKEYIVSSLAKENSNQEKAPVPWLAILKSLPLWAIVVAHTGNNWGYYMLLTKLPDYMKNILNFNIAENGFLSALPYLCNWISMNLAAWLADSLREKKTLDTTQVRKIWTCIGLLCPAVLLVVVTYMGCDQGWAVAVLCLAVGLSGFGMSGFNINHLDIAPKFAGTLLGITNSFATLPGMLSPLAVSVITDQKQTFEKWRIVFYIAAAIYAGSTVFYSFFGSGEAQSWAVSSSAAPQNPDEETQSLLKDGEMKNLYKSIPED